MIWPLEQRLKAGASDRVKRDASLIRLSRDHQRGLALSKRIDDVLAGVDGAPLEQLERETLDIWQNGLLPHFRAECECVLARLARKVGARDALIERTQEDHLRVHSLVTSLRETGVEAERRTHLADIATLLREHIRWEEAVLFEAAQERLTADELTRLGADLSQRLPEIPAVPPWYETGARRQAADFQG